jgi:hypothetical protein
MSKETKRIIDENGTSAKLVSNDAYLVEEFLKKKKSVLLNNI